MKKLFTYMPTYSRPDAIRTQLRMSYTTVNREVKQVQKRGVKMSNVKHAPEIFALLYCDRLYKLEKG